MYNDLQLTHVARDAARYLSVGNEAGAEDTVDNAVLISTTVDSSGLEPGSHDEDSTVTLTATYHAITPLPGFTGIGSDIPINATAIMRRE